MKTVEEILRETGLTDEQIKAIDAKALSGLTQVVSTAQKTLDDAELAKRANVELYQNEISPALDKWMNDKAAQDSENAALRAALKAAEEGGFKIPDMLKTSTTTTTTRANDGTFVAGKNVVPGSPQFEQKLRDDIGGAFSFVADTSWKYRTLYGTEMPDSPTTIIREATAQRMSPTDYAAKKYDFAGKEAAKKAEEQKKHDDAIRAETKAASDKEWSEKVGNNPNIRQAEVSRFSTLDKAVKAGERPDPLKMNREERTAATRQAINKDIAANATVN